MKKKRESIEVTTDTGAVITITPTERGAQIEVDDNHRLVYTSFVTDNVRMIRFEVEPRYRKGNPRGLPGAGETRPLT